MKRGIAAAAAGTAIVAALFLLSAADDPPPREAIARRAEVTQAQYTVAFNVDGGAKDAGCGRRRSGWRQRRAAVHR